MIPTMPTHIIALAGFVLNDDGGILMIRHARRGWEFPGGQVEVGENLIDAVRREIFEETSVEVDVGEVCCISSNTCTYPGYNGVKEIPTKLMLDFICHAKAGTPAPSPENSESRYAPAGEALGMIETPAMRERFKAYLEYAGRPTYLEYVTKPEFQLKLKTLI